MSKIIEGLNKAYAKQAQRHSALVECMKSLDCDPTDLVPGFHPNYVWFGLGGRYVSFSVQDIEIDGGAHLALEIYAKQGAESGLGAQTALLAVAIGSSSVPGAFKAAIDFVRGKAEISDVARAVGPKGSK